MRILTLTAVILALASLAQATPIARVEGIGPYRFEMSPDDVRRAVPRGRFFERWLDRERYPQLEGTGSLTMGPPHIIRGRNFAVILKFNHERRLFKIDLMHMDWARTREECFERHLDILADLSARHGPFDDAAARPGMQRIIDGRVFGVYAWLTPEDTRDSVIQPETHRTPDGSTVQHYRATLEAPDLRRVSSDWGSDQRFISDFVESDAQHARYIFLSTGVSPLTLEDEPSGPYRFDCVTSINIADPSIESRVT